MTAKYKYVAEGFYQDAEKLLKEFVAKETLEFSAFTSVWRKRNFSLIFMGRIDVTDASEFTNEIFRVTLHFLKSNYFPYQVGGIYLLYSLFLTQVLDPPIKIRTTLGTWTRILAIHEEAILKNYGTLQYVIEYLMKESLDLVARDTLKGPLISALQEDADFCEKLTTLQKILKADLTEYCASNCLKEIKEMKLKYLEAKSGISANVEVSRESGIEEYDRFMEEVEELLYDQPSKSKVGNKVADPKPSTSSNIGSKRVRLKAESFARHSFNMWNKDMGNDEDMNKNKDVNEKVNVTDEEDKAQKKNTQRQVATVKKSDRTSKKAVQEESNEFSSDESDDINDAISNLINQREELYQFPSFSDEPEIQRKPRRNPLYEDKKINFSL